MHLFSGFLSDSPVISVCVVLVRLCLCRVPALTFSVSVGRGRCLQFLTCAFWVRYQRLSMLPECNLRPLFMSLKRCSVNCEAVVIGLADLSHDTWVRCLVPILGPNHLPRHRFRVLETEQSCFQTSRARLPINVPIDGTEFTTRQVEKGDQYV